MMLTWLPGDLRAAGLDVYVLPGAEARTSRAGGLTVNGVVWHHTATSTTWQDGHVAALLRDGRRDLAGPLAQIGVERDGTIVIVALGRANHNGYGEWGNDSIGLEFYNDGRGEPFTPAQHAAGLRATAAILQRTGLPPGRVKGHKETDPTRKIDPLLSMPGIRADIERTLNPPAPVPPSKEPDDMHLPALIVQATGQSEWWLTDGITKQHIKSTKHADVLRYLGKATWDGTKNLPHQWDPAVVASLRTVA